LFVYYKVCVVSELNVRSIAYKLKKFVDIHTHTHTHSHTNCSLDLVVLCCSVLNNVFKLQKDSKGL